MNEHWFCPHCRIALPNGEQTSECPSCKADFGPSASWGPVTNNKGKWVPRPRMEQKDEPSISYALGLLFIRLILGALGLLVVTVVALLSAMPYGGGNRDLFVLGWTVLVVVPFWAAAPLVTTLFRLFTSYLESRRARQARQGQSRERRR